MQIVGGFRDLWRGGIAAGGGLSGPAVWILANRTTGVSPAGVFFEAVVTGFSVDRPAHDLHFKWTFDDPGSYTAIAADHPHGVASDTSYGPMTAHCFATPGSYTVTLEVTDGIQSTTATCDVTVTDPDAAFAGAATYAISGTGDFTGAAAGSVQVSDLAAAVAHAQTVGRRSVRFQFCKGASHSTGFSVAGASFDTLHFSAYGSGVSPVLNGGLSVTGNPLSGAVSIDGLALRGGFDPKVGGSVSVDGVELAKASAVTLHALDIAGFGIGVRYAEGQVNAILSDSQITDWAESGLHHFAADRSAVIGCSIQMDVDSLPMAVADGPGRLGGRLGRYVLWHCDLFSAAGQPSHAPCWRWNIDGLPGASGVIGRTRFEGGSPVLACAPTLPATEADPGELILEKCYLLGSAATGPAGLASIGYGGTSLRSSVLVMPDVEPEQGTDAKAFLTGGSANSSLLNDAAPVQIYSNAFVDLRTTDTLIDDAQSFAIVDSSEFSHWHSLSIDNNLTHAPALAVPVTPHEPVDATVSFLPLYRGKRDIAGLDPAYATPAASAALFAPTPGPGGLPAAGSGLLSLDDFYGVFRGASAEIGAIEHISTLSVSVLGTGTFEVSGTAAGIVQLTVDPPSIHAGTYEVDTITLEDSPVFLLPPSTSGSTAVGETLTAVSGLVVFLATDGEPIPSWTWRQGVSVVGTGPTYVVQAADETVGLSLEQSLVNAAPNVATSTAVVIEAAVPVVSGTTGSPTITSDANYDYYLFNNSGSITFSHAGLLDAELLGGGGGGGGGNYSAGGGGGAGALVFATGLAVSAQAYAVTVGSGGTGGLSVSTAATKGGASTAFSQTAPGGGAGRTNSSLPAAGMMDGGCGGGGYSSVSSGGTGSVGGNGGQGNGNRAGGGGGMGGTGGTGTFNGVSGDGGAAVQSILDGEWLAEGGAGSPNYNPADAGVVQHGGGAAGAAAHGGNGLDGTGSGGGGGGGGSSKNGGAGGSGRVLIRIPKSV